jgi:hypothetical protein
MDPQTGCVLNRIHFFCSMLYKTGISNADQCFLESFSQNSIASFSIEVPCNMEIEPTPDCSPLGQPLLFFREYSKQDFEKFPIACLLNDIFCRPDNYKGVKLSRKPAPFEFFYISDSALNSSDSFLSQVNIFVFKD